MAGWIRTRRIQPYWPYLVLLAEVLVFYRRVLFQPADYSIPWDFRSYHFNLTSFIADSLRSGQFPWWDPYTYCGTPFFANLQTQLFYPPMLLAVLVNSALRGEHLLYLMTLQLILHILLAGVCTVWLLQALGCSQLAAVIGATAFQLGCYFSSQTQHLGAIDAGAWLPLCALAVMKMVLRRSAKWTAILGLSLGMTILAGFSATIGAVFLCIFVLTLALIASRIASWTLIVSVGIAAVSGIALAAVQLVPSIQNAALSVSRFRADWRAPGTGIRAQALVSLVWPNYFHILDLRGYVLPYNFTFLYLYCAIGTLALVALALGRRRSPYAVTFLVLIAVSALIMTGDATSIGRVVNHYFVVATRDSIYPEFMMLGFSFGIAVLAGLGANRFAARTALLTIIQIVIIVELTWAGSGRPMNTTTRQEPGVTSSQFDGSVPLLKAVRDQVNRYQPPARLDTFVNLHSWAAMAETIRIPTANGDDPFALIRFMDVRRLFTGGTRWGRYYEVAELTSPILDLLNVRFLVSRNPLAVNPKWMYVAELPGHLLFENSAALPRFFLVRHTVAAKTPDEGIALMRASEFNPAQVAVIEEPAHEYPDGEQAPVRVVAYRQNEVVLETDSAQPRFLATSETDYPGWRAWVDGTEVSVVRTNVAFRGLSVPSGHHQVVFQFRPVILLWSAALSAIALGLLAWAALPWPRDTVNQNVN